MRFVGKVALITGGAQGLGRAFADALLEQGAKVSLVDIDGRLGRETEESLRQKHGPGAAIFTRCDVTNSEQLTDVFRATHEKFGRLDIVVNNAGIGDEKNWERTVGVNLVALIRGCQEGLRYMRRDLGGRGGLIVNISSLAGIVAPAAIPVYSATKHGVIGFTRSLANTYPLDETFGVRISCLCPSFTDTKIMSDMEHQLKGVDPSMEESAQRLLAGVGALGLMKPEAVVKGFMRLVGDDEAHGAVLLVTPAGMEYKYPSHMKGKL